MNSIRPAVPEDAPAIARVHVDTWRSTYPGIVPDSYLAGLSYAASGARWRQHLEQPGGELTFLALDPAGVVIGFASCGPLREPAPGFDGELYGLYLLAAWHGCGIGRGLFTHAAHNLIQRGFRSMLLWVLRDNQTRAFYEHLGGEPVGEKTIEIGGTSLIDVAYGWPELGIIKVQD